MRPMDFLRAGLGRPDQRAVVSAEERLTFAELDVLVDRRAAEISEGPTKDGWVVPIVLETDVQGVVELFALWRAGRVPAPLNPRLSVPERAAAEAALAGADIPDETQFVLWTSGTSGQPRGVALSWLNLFGSLRGSLDRLELGADGEVWLASLSLAHVGGLALVTRALYLGSTLLVPTSARPEEMVSLLGGEGGDGPVPTHLSLVPTQLRRILDLFGERPAPDPVRCVLIGGAHAPRSLVDRALALGWPIALTYGATEMSSQIATAPPVLVRAKPGTVGEPLSDVKLRIDESGEILARGPTQALGYVGTETALADEDGWYHTGDLGRLDEDGHLWITGRRIDRIVSGGVTIDAVEVEEALRTHPAVIDACVVGVADEEWGERVGAWIEPVVGEFDVEEVETELRERLSAAKLPRVWLVEGGLPRNANGKVDRDAVRRRLG